MNSSTSAEIAEKPQSEPEAPDGPARIGVVPRLVIADDSEDLALARPVLEMLTALDSRQVIQVVIVDDPCATRIDTSGGRRAGTVGLLDIVVEQRAQAVQRPHDEVLVPHGDSARLLVDLARFVVRAARLAATEPGMLPINGGFPPALAAELAGYAPVIDERHLAHEIARAKRYVQSKAVPVGEGRLLVEVLGQFSVVVPADDRRWTPNLLAQGCVDPSLSRFLDGVIGEGDLVVHAGANVGADTVHLGRLAGNGGRVLAVEAASPLFPYLEENIARNRLAGVIQCLQVEAWDRAEGPQELLEAAWFGAEPRGRSVPSTAAVPPRPVTVSCGPRVPIDDLIADDDTVALALLQSQGGEARGLVGLSNLVANRRVRRIVLGCRRESLGPDWDLFVAAARLLERQGWHVAALDNETGIPRELSVDILVDVGGLPNVVLSAPPS